MIEIRRHYGSTVWYILLIGPLLCLLSCVDDRPFGPITQSTGVVINEIFPTGDPDWIELYNPGAIAQDLTGYRIYDSGSIDDKFVLNDLLVPPNGFLILFCDDQGSGNHTNFKLSSTGETVFLENPDGALVQLIAFPALQAGQSYGRKPDGDGQLMILSTSSEGKSNLPVNIPLVITIVSRIPQFPSPADTVWVNATILDDSMVQTVRLYYAAGSDTFQTVVMAPGIQHVYKGTIPPLPEATSVRYYIQAVDDSGAVATRPPEAPDMTFSYISSQAAYVPPRLFINEFLASNTQVNQDPDFQDFSDWIEIYNTESQSVDMGGMYLTDDLSTPRKWIIPAGTTISAGGHLLFWADDMDTRQTAHHTNFKLSKGGESIGLFDRDIVNNVSIDTYVYSSQDDDVSFGRVTDGHPSFQPFTTPTPGASN